MELKELLTTTIKSNASDLHLIPGVPPAIRIDGALNYLTDYPALTHQILETLLYSAIRPEQKEIFLKEKELDFSMGFGGGDYGNMGRFRVNYYFQRGYVCAAFRFLQPDIKTIEDLGLPNILHNFSDLRQGFILVTGPTGHGKSTTIASIINEINKKRAAHIITIEDPIEYMYPAGKSMISQREMETDTHSWDNALRSALREDPDVVMIGEMRDPETISAALTIAETGHLVFSTLHTNSAAQSIDRIIDSFPANQQNQVKIQLSAVLKGVVSQRLLPKINGGRIPAVEVLIGTNAIANNIREGKTHLIDSTIQTSQDVGMIMLESSLASLVLSGNITLETARSYALRLDELLHILG